MSVSMMKVSFTVGALGFLAYCVYFDRKRRSDPNFRAKLKEKRLKAKQAKESTGACDIPVFKDPSDMQAYFLKEVQLSDDLMQNGQFEEATVHLANATVVCSQKTEFLGVMQRTLPAPVFQLLIQNYQIANERYLQKLLTSPELTKNPLQQQQSPQFNDTDIE